MIPQVLHVHGPGRCGTALARMLRARGTKILSISGGSGESGANAAREFGVPFTKALPVLPESAWLLIAVPDDVLPRVAEELARGPLPEGGMAWHPAAMHGRLVLAPLAARGMNTAAFHPLCAMPSGVELPHFDDALIAVDAEPAHTERLRALAEALGGRPIHVPDAARAAWHLGATLAGNGPVALLQLAVRVWQQSGIEPALAWPALAKLALPVIERAGHAGVQGLTGPIVRGDAATVAAHLKHMASEHPESVKLLRSLDEELLRAAVSLPGDLNGREEISRMLKEQS